MCKICNDYGFINIYRVPIVVRECCKCDVGQKQKEFVERTLIKDTTPVWELFTL